MSKELIVDSSPHETRVAILENDRLVHIHIERESESPLVGSIFKGRVTRVLPGMESAFVDIGIGRDAFLYVSDLLEDSKESNTVVKAHDTEAEKTKEITGQSSAKIDSRVDLGRRRHRSRRSHRKPLKQEKFSEPQSTPLGEHEASPRKDISTDLPPSETKFPVLPGEYLAKYRDRNSQAEKHDSSNAEMANDSSDKSQHLPEPNRRESTQRILVSSPEPKTRNRSTSSTGALQPKSQTDSLKAKRLSPGSRSSLTKNTETRTFANSKTLADTQSKQLKSERVHNPNQFLNRVTEKSSKIREWVSSFWNKLLAKLISGKTNQLEPSPDIDTSVSATKKAPPESLSQARTTKFRSHGRSSRYFRHHKRRRGPRDTSSKSTAGNVVQESHKPSHSLKQRQIKDLLSAGQEVLVQISKEPLGRKGARITSHISLPGRYLVYMPTVDHPGVSRKIVSDSERRRLRKAVIAHQEGKPGGFIVRTAGKGAQEEEIADDMKFLYNLWLGLSEKAGNKSAPSRIHQDLDVVERVLRDQLTETFKTIWVEGKEEHERILSFVERFQPNLTKQVKLHTGKKPIFDEFDITKELEKALRPKVWLKSGGYIVINQTEALVAIDVNTGKYVGKSHSLEETIVNTNLEAVQEIVRQMRLRDLGGIIVIDFIDMDDRKNRSRVMTVLEQELKSDRAPTKALQFNNFGLVSITRKRVKQSLERTLCTPCPYCSGSAYVKSNQTIICEILTQAKKIARSKENRKNITLRVSQEMARILQSRDNNYKQDIEKILGANILVRSDGSLHRDKFRFHHAPGGTRGPKKPPNQH